MGKKNNDSDLYQKMIDGDVEALKEVLELYGKKLIYFINGYINDLTYAEDIMEDSFCDLIISGKKFRSDSSFKTYLFAIAKNKAYDHIKKSSRLRTVSLDDAREISDDMQLLEEYIVNDEEKRDLHRAMDSLNEDYRQALYLFYFEDMSYEEIGKVLHKSTRQIKNILYRAKQSLKVKLKEANV